MFTTCVSHIYIEKKNKKCTILQRSLDANNKRCSYKRNEYCEINTFIYHDHVQRNLCKLILNNIII